MGEGIRRKQKLWTAKGRQELEGLALGGWANRRRQQLLEMLDRLDRSIEEWEEAVIQEARSRPWAVRWMQHPGVGPVTARAFVLTIAEIGRFRRSQQLVSDVGLHAKESSSGGQQRLGSISKQGNSMLRFWLVEAAQTASRFDPE